MNWSHDHSDFGVKFRFWAPAFLTPKSIFFLTSCKIPDGWIYHTAILILGPKFRFIFAFLIPKSIYDVFHLKRNIYLKILDRPSQISTKLFLNFIRLFLRIGHNDLQTKLEHLKKLVKKKNRHFD
jgi:hypothetical protein